MSTALLRELYQETRRLYIAGSELAADDYRLKRLLPQFQQLGERAPVFKRLGEGIASLIDPTSPADSAARLQELTLLLTSVLHTQGTNVPDGELVPIESRPTELPTRLPYRKLADIEAALTTTGGGRYEIVKQAFEDGMFEDLRLFPLAIAALNDPYAELAEYAMNYILPSYGKAVVTHLVAQFDPNGGKSEARKLAVIGRMDGDTQLDLITQAADSGSEDVRITAIGLLGEHDAYEQLLFEWTKDKKKAIREAAYRALLASGTMKAIDWLHAAFNGKDANLVSQVMTYNAAPQLLTDRLSEDWRLILQAEANTEDKKSAEASTAKMRLYYQALQDKQGCVLDELCQYALEHNQQLMKRGWIEPVSWAARYASMKPMAEMLPILFELEIHINPQHAVYAFWCARKCLTKEQLYDHYAGPDALLSEQLQYIILKAIQQEVLSNDWESYATPFGFDSYGDHITMKSLEYIAEQWDERWLDWFVGNDLSELVCVFARPGHDRSVEYLSHKLHVEKLSVTTATQLLMGLERVGLDRQVCDEATVQALERMGSLRYLNLGPYFTERLSQLPHMYRARLEAIMEKHNARDDTHKIMQNVIHAMNPNVEGAVFNGS